MRYAVVHDPPTLGAWSIIAFLLKVSVVALFLIAVLGVAAFAQQPSVRNPIQPPVLRESDPVAIMRLEANRATRDSIVHYDSPRSDSTPHLADVRVVALLPVEVSDRMSTTIHFDVGRSEIREDAVAAMEGKLDLLRGLPEMRIRIEGQADTRGSNPYNIGLAWSRAGAAKLWLTDRGIASDRIDAVGFSSRRPICQDAQESCWWQNRRAEFVIVAGADADVPRTR